MEATPMAEYEMTFDVFDTVRFLNSKLPKTVTASTLTETGEYYQVNWKNTWHPVTQLRDASCPVEEHES
jgi:hypothetical protein